MFAVGLNKNNYSVVIRMILIQTIFLKSVRIDRRGNLYVHSIYLSVRKSERTPPLSCLV